MTGSVHGPAALPTVPCALLGLEAVAGSGSTGPSVGLLGAGLDHRRRVREDLAEFGTEASLRRMELGA
jgi:hypothetical protein